MADETPEQPENACPTCEGTGKENGETCTTCGGDGVIEEVGGG